MRPESGSDLPAVVQPGDLVMSRPAEVVLDEAHKAAKALQGVLQGKKNKVMIRGEQYPEFEDWQVLGRFYGLTSKVAWSRPVDENCMPITPEFPLIPSGFESRAVIVNQQGMEISSAEALCMRSEEHWGDRPIFQVKSMSQTRACAKAFRNVLAWVIVLAGYRGTPAEEMITGESTSRKAAADRPVSEGQGKLIYVLLKKTGVTNSAEQKDKVVKIIGRSVEHMADLTFEEASRTIDALNEEIKTAGGTP